MPAPSPLPVPRTPSPRLPGRAELLAAHGPRVRAMCLRLCVEPDDAYQEIWLKVFGALHQFDPDGEASIGTWICVIASRHLIDRHRRRRARGEALPLGELPVELAAPEPGALGETLVAERRSQLERALATLPEAQRRAVALHHIDGLPLEQIAALEEVAVGTIKSRLHRGRAALLRRLQPTRSGS